jgi:hypothetical protein
VPYNYFVEAEEGAELLDGLGLEGFDSVTEDPDPALSAFACFLYESER